MTSESEQQIITIHTLPNISRRKGKQSIKFSQKEIFFLINLAENEAGRLVPDLFLLFEY